LSERRHAPFSIDLAAELTRRLLLRLGSPSVAVGLWDGRSIVPDTPAPVARVRIRDRATLWRIARGGERALGEAYCDGGLEVHGDLVVLLTELFHSWRNSDTSLVSDYVARIRARRQPNDRVRSRRNAEHHYDLSKEFYALWLDSELSYTCAYYLRPDCSLEEAQRAKLEHVGRKLRLKPGERVVEAGGGWGTLALYLARRFGVAVRSYNVSREQIDHARARARAEHLESQVEFIEEDYREIRGEYDAFVSVGMLEHVGYAEFPTLAGVIDACLSSTGRGLIHSIGRMRPAPMDEWLQTHIFPGAYIPSLGQMIEVLEPTNLEALDVENLRMHYAQTLVHWLERFDQNEGAIRSRFGDHFLREWRLYLAASIASFRTSGCQLFQLTFARPGYSTAPLTREDLYRPSQVLSREWLH